MCALAVGPARSVTELLSPFSLSLAADCDLTYCTRVARSGKICGVEPMNITAPESSQLGPAAAAVMALVFAGAGSAILALAYGWLPINPARLEAPRWVIASAGVMFIAGGFAPLAAAWRLPAWASQFTGLCAASGLAAVLNWVAFFPGERHFSASSMLLGLQLGSSANGEATGRVLFGLFALLLDGILLVALGRLVRALRRRYNG